jgi:hypothetical protein
MSDLLGDEDDEVARLQAIAFAELYRRDVHREATGGHPTGEEPDAGELWERAGTVELEFVIAPPDPLAGGSSGTSPPSATSGA